MPKPRSSGFFREEIATREVIAGELRLAAVYNALLFWGFFWGDVGALFFWDNVGET